MDKKTYRICSMRKKTGHWINEHYNYNNVGMAMRMALKLSEQNTNRIYQVMDDDGMVASYDGNTDIEIEIWQECYV